MQKQIIDQTLHFVISGVAAYLISMTLMLSESLYDVYAFITIAIVIAVGFIRELYQHTWSIYEMGFWSWVDMLFIVLGAIVGTYIII